jgi:RHH-type proline utilization regulon transcriptional repressor/proline dehydrogenase/delta 1-pyrroline-5-carboxylate dehydrogenase
MHYSELFGPVLAIIAYDTLEEAIKIQNDTDFGLTGGIHSLDPVELKFWKSRVEVGNAYLNRSITGAIVQRQAFGGWKGSSLGPGAKAGGPNYLSQFVTPVSERLPEKSALLTKRVATLLKRAKALAPAELHDTLHAAAGNAAYWWKKEFSQEKDPSALPPESNIFRYRPVPGVTLRRYEELTLSDLLISALMARTAGVPLELSVADSTSDVITKAARTLELKIVTESEDEMSARLAKHPLATLRTPGRQEIELHHRNSSHPVLPHARLELLPYLLEQALSETVHRHGRIGIVK